MSRLFDDASSQYLTYTGAAVTTTPLTLACWFYSNDTAAAQGLVALGYSDAVDTSRFVLTANGNIAGDPVRATAHDAGTIHPAVTTTGYSANTWHHACGVFASSTSRSAYIDGGSKGTTTNSHTPIGIDRTYIGVVEGAGLTNYMSGRIAEAAIWNVALTDAEVLMLSKNRCPLFVRPANLVSYWPLLGANSPEIDPVGKYDMTLTNGPTKAEHPRILYPAPPHIVRAPPLPVAHYINITQQARVTAAYF